MEKSVKRIISVFVFIALLVLWYLLSTIVNNSLFIPTPLETIQMWITMVKGDLVWHIVASFKRITIAVFLAGAIAIPLGLMIAKVTAINYVLNPMINFLRYIPITAFSPLLMLFIGIGEDMKILLIFIAVFLQYLPIVIHEFEDVDKRVLETATTMGFSDIRSIWYVVIPYTTPELLRNFISLYGVGWTYVIIAEVTNANWGLGHLMYIGSARGNTKMVFAALITIIAINILFDKIGKWIIKKKFAWRYREDE